MNKNRNIVKKWLDLSEGTNQRDDNFNDILMNSSFLSNMVSTHSFDHIFNKMLSSLEWHPKQNLILIGSRGGDVSCVDLNSHEIRHCSRGLGRGQQITNIKFDLLDNNWFYTTSTSGKLVKQRLDGNEDILLKDCYDSRFSSLDMCSNHKLLIAGDSNGSIHLTHCWEQNTNDTSLRIHSSNILHSEFNKFNTNLFITASIDCSAKLWDIRMLSNKCLKPVMTIKQSYPLNSATFSLTNGSTLLITNHFDEISVYRGPDWQLESCIKHCHHQTHRFCLLKAKWHPFTNLCVIGSFSSNSSNIGQYYERPQTIDIIDVKRRQIKSSLSDGTPGVISIADFNSSGDKIAGIKGQNLIVFEYIGNE